MVQPIPDYPFTKVQMVFWPAATPNAPLTVSFYGEIAILQRCSQATKEKETIQIADKRKFDDTKSKMPKEWHTSEPYKTTVHKPPDRSRASYRHSHSNANGCQG
jgi:hypothetical protein